jgi:hypothetical protein
MNFLKIKLLVIAVIMFAASSAFASLSYEVTVDTSSLATTVGNGYLYLQYGGIDAVTSTATVSNFVTDGILAAAPSPAGTLGGSTGTLNTGTGTVAFTSGAAYGTTDYNHGIQFGNALSFLVSFASTPGGTAGGASTFSLALFGNADGTNPLLNTTDPIIAGTGVMVNLMNDGTTSATSLDSTAAATPTPIPAAFWLLGSGLMGLVGMKKRK